MGKKKAILISCFDWYDKRLHPIVNLIEKKYDALILTSDYSHINKMYIKDKNPNCDYLHVPAYKSNISAWRIISHLCFGVKVKKCLYKMKPDLIYLLLPPNNIAHYVVKYKKKYPKVKFIVDMIDLWPESMPFQFMSKTKIFKLWKSLRDDAVRNADGVVVECNYYKKYIETKSPTYTLYVLKNQTKEEARCFNKYIKKWTDINFENLKKGKIVLGYVGSINNIIDIDLIVSIINNISTKYKVEIHIIGEGRSRAYFIEKLKETDANVIYHGMIFREVQKMEILGKCNYGINIMKDEVSVGLTIKSIDYFSYGLPIINNIKGDTWKMVENDNLGINVMDNENIVNEIVENSNWLSIRENIHRIYEHKFSYDSVQDSVGDLFNL